MAEPRLSARQIPDFGILLRKLTPPAPGLIAAFLLYLGAFVCMSLTPGRTRNKPQASIIFQIDCHWTTYLLLGRSDFLFRGAFPKSDLRYVGERIGLVRLRRGFILPRAGCDDLTMD